MILTDDDELAKRAKHITTQAKSRPDEYDHDEVGYNYRLVNLLAAMGVAQMEQLPGFLKRKKEVSDLYNKAFREFREFQPQNIAREVNANHWLYTVSVPNQTLLRRYLHEKQIEVRPIWVPMKSLPFLNDCIYVNKYDHSNTLYSSSLSLPCSTGITDLEVHTVVDQIERFYNK